MSNLRDFPRSTLRTLVTVLCDGPQGNAAPVVIKAWSEDISPSGMQFACDEELPAGRIYARILLPDLEDRILECDVVRRGGRSSSGIFRKTGPKFFYGVRFTQVHQRAAFEAQVASRPGIRPVVTQALAASASGR